MTRHRDQVQKAFKVNAFRYLYKPLRDEEVREVLADAIDDLKDTEARLVYDRDSDASYLVRLRDIFYIESIGDYSVVHTMEKDIVTTSTLRGWKDNLDGRFFQCHKSYIINLHWIRTISEGQVTLQGIKQVPVSVRNRSELKKAFHEYIKKNARYI